MVEEVDALYSEALKYEADDGMSMDAASWARMRGWLEPVDEKMKEDDLIKFLESEVKCLQMRAAKAFRVAPGGDSVRAMRVENLSRDFGCEGLAELRSQIEGSLHLQEEMKRAMNSHEAIQNRAALDQINAALCADFEVRRAMLLKRCDVTIQSFLWGDAAKGQESDIVAAIEAMRHSLRKQPASITVDDALALSRNGLEALQTRLNEKSLLIADDAIKKTLIGEVPHRGGNAKQGGRKSAGPAWTERQSGDTGGGGGRKGGRRGGYNNKRARSGSNSK
mmetsp:Transcript_7487/g.10402  ORF Transcript_7487/g.10402 Transcript_7487/m.10402 type:complete len:279 (+) Transcript_7487:2014-2850(+)